MMPNSQPPIPPGKPPIQWPSLIQLILSLLAGLLLLLAAVAIVFSASSKYLSRGAGVSDPTESFMTAASLAFAGVLVLPSAWYAWRHIAVPESEPAPHPERRGTGVILTIVVVVLVGGVLVLGNWISQNNQITWLVLPPLNILAVGLPALWVMYIGTRGLIPGRPRWQWGVFASGLVLGPLIILVLEFVLLVFIGMLAFIWIMLNPSLANQLNSLAFRLQNAGQNTEAILKLFVPFLQNPGIIFLLFAFISVLVPLLEEAFKPIGVWFLAGQKISPAQGFGYGVLSGTGVGLFENLGYTSGWAAGWALLASARISNLLLHSFLAGLMGWALVSAWRERRYLRLAVTYAVAVSLHGLWNGLALLSGVISIQGITNVSLPANIQQIGALSSWGVSILGFVVLLLYIGANTALRYSQISPASPTPAVAQAPKPPEVLPPASSPDEPSQSPSEISPTHTQSQGDNPSHTESDRNHLNHGENSSSTMGTN